MTLIGVRVSRYEVNMICLLEVLGFYIFQKIFHPVWKESGADVGLIVTFVRQSVLFLADRGDT
jgi:hypothetical protein